jgi:hypothetical protein
MEEAPDGRKDCSSAREAGCIRSDRYRASSGSDLLVVRRVQGEKDHTDPLYCVTCIPPLQQLGFSGVRVGLHDVGGWPDLEGSPGCSGRDQVYKVRYWVTM